MILVDDAVWPWRGLRWCHLVSDSSYDELHSFAQLLGVPRRGFQGDHYDLPEEHRARAVSSAPPRSAAESWSAGFGPPAFAAPPPGR